MSTFCVTLKILFAVFYFKSVSPLQAGESTDGAVSFSTGVETDGSESDILRASDHSSLTVSQHASDSMKKPESTSTVVQPSVVITAESPSQLDEDGTVAASTMDGNGAVIASEKVDDPGDQREPHTESAQDDLKTDAMVNNIMSTVSEREQLASPTHDDVQQKQIADQPSAVTTNETIEDASKDEAMPLLEESVTASLSQQPEASVDAGELSAGSKVEMRDKAATDHQQDFQSYTEWRQKVLEEEQKSKQDNTIPLVPMPVPLKSKQRINFSSKNCGAKVLASNQEAENVQGVLTGNKDDYMLNPCSAQKKWFAIELCEPIQVKTVEIASLELFSSQPKTFRVSLSDRFPAKDWQELGEYEATQEKTAQAFQVDDQQFVKFVKVELVSHYNNEHFCPVTLFRVFGVPMADDDDDNPENIESTNSEEETVILQDGDEDEAKDNSRNLFMSAKDTVMNLVKKVLNVDEAEQSTTGNTPNEKDVGLNYSHDGYLLPCVPEGDSKVSEVKWESAADVPTVAVPLPSTQPGPADTPIVTKLQDDEQIPSEHSGNEKLVTLLSSQYQGSVEICSTPSQQNKTSPHRMFCSYIQTMLSNKITQTCSSHPEPTVVSSRQKAVPSLRTPSDTSSKHETGITVSNSLLEESPELNTSHGSAADTVGSLSVQETRTDDRDRSVSASHEESIVDNCDRPVKDTTVSLVDSTQTITESVTVSLEAEQDDTQPAESNPSVSSSHQESEEVTNLKPSSTPSFVEDTHKLTQTPVLETQQPWPGGTQDEDLGKTSLSSKVSPSPAMVVSSSVDTLPTKVIATMVEEVEEHKDSSSQEVDTTESVVKAENITANKDKPLDLMQVPVAPVAKRETAIMRLTNRIKSLELNVSLSSRFLDELSHRFKKQSEDMMRLLNKTTAHFNNVTGRAELKVTLQQEQLEKLESRVENLTALMTELFMSMEDLNNKITDRQLVWTTVEFLLLAVVCVVCLRRGGSPSIHPDVRHLLEMMPSHPSLTGNVRRNSVGAVGHVLPPSPIRKQTSESALVAAIENERSPSFEIVEQGNSLLSQQPVQKDGNKKKKKKKHKNLEPKSSTEAVSPDGSESLSATQLTESAGLLFGADAVTVLTGVFDPSCTIEKTEDKKSTSERTSTKSLPTHSRQSSQSFIEIQKNPGNVTALPKKLSLPNTSSTASHCGSLMATHICPPGIVKADPPVLSADATVQTSDRVLAVVQGKTLTNGAMSDSKPMSGRTSAHMWKSTGQYKPLAPPTPPPPPPPGGTHYPGLKGSKSNIKQKSWSFKKSIGFE